MNQERFTLEIPMSRKAFADCWNAPKNRKLMYCLALAAWTILVMFIIVILSLTATSVYRVAFYLPFTIFLFLLPLSTHWLIYCVREDYRATVRDEQTVYNVMADDTHIASL